MTRRMHILIVEDNADDAMLLKILLERRQEIEVTAEWAVTVQSAVTRVERGGVDAAVIDLTMPDGSGTEIVERITKAAPGLPSVVYTGRQKECVEDAALAAGASAVLQKPADPDELVKQLRFAVIRGDDVRKRKELAAIIGCITGTVAKMEGIVDQLVDGDGQHGSD